MRYILLRLAAIFFSMLLVACSDLPTTAPAADVAGAGPLRSGECRLQGDGTYLCPPESPDWGDECDPYHYDCGADDCISSTGPGNLEEATTQGCTGGGGGDDGGSIGDDGDIGGGGDSGGGGGGGGGGIRCPDWDPECASTEPDPEPKPEDESEACEDLGCKLRDPSDPERQRVLELINTLRTDGFCAQVRESALQMVNRRLQLWDNTVLYTTGDTLYAAAPWDYSRGGHVMYIWTGALTAWTIAHEAIHGIWNPAGIGHYYTHTDTTPVGLDLDATAGYCSGH